MTAASTPAAPSTTPQGNGKGAVVKRVERSESQRQMEHLKQLIEARRETIADVLPKHMTPERLIKLASVAVGRTPKLLECTPISVVSSIIKAAELGLDCSGTLGSAYLVPFDRNEKQQGGGWRKVSEAQLIIGYRGLIDLARRSGQIASIEARVVYQNDEFEVEYGLEPRLRHVPAIDREPGELRLVYGIARLKDGATQVEVMTRTEIDAIRERSQSGRKRKDAKTGQELPNKFSPWHTDYPEMARKTVVKRLCKYLPLSVEFAETIAADNDSDPIDVIEAPTTSALARLNESITQKPVSENQEFVAEPDAETNMAAQHAEDGEEIPADPDAPPEPKAGEKPADAAEAERIIEEKARQARGPDAGKMDEADAPPATEALEQGDEGEQRAQSSPAEITDYSDWQNGFMAAFDAEAKKVGKSPEDADKALGTSLMRVQKKGKGSQTTLQWRSDLITAIRAGRYDWATGTVRRE